MIIRVTGQIINIPAKITIRISLKNSMTPIYQSDLNKLKLETSSLKKNHM
jgi:hypothetical protein